MSHNELAQNELPSDHMIRLIFASKDVSCTVSFREQELSLLLTFFDICLTTLAN